MWQSRRFFELKKLPSPAGRWPILGHTPLLIRAIATGGWTKLFFRWYRELGDVFVVWRLRTPEVVISNPAIIKHILTDGQRSGRFQRGGPIYKAYETVFGAHMGNQVGENWKWRRDAWAGVATPCRFYRSFDTLLSAATQLIEQIAVRARAQDTVKLDPVFSALHMRIIAHFVLGIPVSRLGTDTGLPQFDFARVFASLEKLEKQLLIQSFTGSWIANIPTTRSRDYRAAKKYLDEVLAPWIDLALQFVQEPRALPEPARTYVSNSMFPHIAKSARYRRQDLHADLQAVLFPRTTSHALSFAVAELALNPEAFRIARESVDAVYADSVTLTLDSVRELDYIEAIFKESLRLHSVVSQISVVTTTDVKLGEHVLPRNVVVNLQLMTAGYSSLSYPDPFRFRPERWLKSDDNSEAKSDFLAFSKGQHSCLGAPLAMLEATIIISLLLRHFDWQLLNGRTSVENTSENFTFFARDGTPVRFRPRKNVPFEATRTTLLRDDPQASAHCPAVAHARNSNENGDICHS